MTYKTLSQGDSDFQFVDGFALVPRASLYLSPDCPTKYQQIIQDCVNRGWLKMTAHMKDSEYTWEKLQS